MAYLKSKTLFFTTSPRTPLKMIPEIKVLAEDFEGKVWNPVTQIDFIKRLAQGKYFQGEGSAKEMALVREIVSTGRRKPWGLLI